jgi:hypothetical protein
VNYARKFLYCLGVALLAQDRSKYLIEREYLYWAALALAWVYTVPQWHARPVHICICDFNR